MRYIIQTFKDAGLQARWTRTRTGAPIISAKAEDGNWYVVDARCWEQAQKIGLKEAFENYNALGKYFSIPA
jgi:hypothetical protein